MPIRAKRTEQIRFKVLQDPKRHGPRRCRFANTEDTAVTNDLVDKQPSSQGEDTNMVDFHHAKWWILNG